MPLPILGALAFVFGASQILNSIASNFPPFANQAGRRAFNQRPDLIPTADQLVGSRIRGIISPDSYYDMMRQNGFDKDVAALMFNSGKQYMSAFEYITLWRRGDITEARCDQYLSELGISNDQIPLVKQASLYEATPQDVVLFNVRDVYEQDTIRKYQLDAEVTETYYKAADRVGLSRKLALQYWMAHWQYPSPTQVNRMLHMRLITQEDAERYYKEADYAPTWRKHLMDISYDVLTRVDARRMYDDGVLSEEELYDAYRDMGYNDLNARRLTEWNVRQSIAQSDTGVKGDIISAYKEGLIDRPTAEVQLAAAKFSTESAKTMLDIVDSRNRKELVDLEADAIIDSYTKGAMSLDLVRAELVRIGVPQGQLEFVLARELAQGRKRAKVASKTDIDTWYVMGFLSDVNYRNKLQALGYSGVDIDYYMAESGIKLLLGGDKKLPYAPPMREYVNGEIGWDVLSNRLGELGYNDHDRNFILTIATDIKP